MEPETKENFYLYGNPEGNEISQEEKKDFFVVYVNPRALREISNSSLEGIFVQEGNLDSLDKKDFIPYEIHKFYFRKEAMKNFEERYKGKFIPFKK